MKYIVVLVVAALLAVSAFAADDQLKVAVQDHTGQILTSMPAAVDASNFADIAAVALGQAPLTSDFEPPVSNNMKRAQASVTVVTMDRLSIATPTTITETNKSQTQAGALIQAVTGANKCLLGSRSLMGQIYTSNEQSMVLAFSSQPEFATSLCASLPTTGPATIIGHAICATLDEFVGPTDAAYSSAESNSAIANVVAIAQQHDFTLLQSQNPGVTVNNDEISINGTPYSRTDPVIDIITRELAYITNVASSLSTFGTITSDSAADAYTFVISSAASVQNNQELIALIERVAVKVVADFAVAYQNNIISQIITAQSELDSSVLCAPGLGDSGVTAPGVYQSTVTDEEIRSYQIKLWLSLALVAIVILGFSSTATMHLFPDPAIQGGQSTYWVHKK